MLDFYVKTRVRFSLRDKRLFEIIEVEIMRIDCIKKYEQTGRMNSSYCYLNIYILGVFSEKHYYNSQPLERDVVYIPVMLLIHATSYDYK